MYSVDASGTHSEISSFNFQLADVPEPGVLGAGMTALLLLMRTRRATARAPH